MLLDQLSQNSNAVHFHHYFQKGRQTAENLRDDLRNYLETLKTFLPLREPESWTQNLPTSGGVLLRIKRE